MDCGQYREWLKGAATGALGPAQNAELRAHLAGCPTCSAALEREELLLAAIERVMGTELAAKPSLEFTARVRTRLAAERISARRWFASWMPAMATAFAVLALVTVWVLRHAPLQPQRPGQVEVTGSRVARGKTASSAVQKTQPGVESRVRPARGPTPRRAAATRTAPDVLVPAGQWEAILRLYEAAQGRQVDASSLAVRRPGPERPIEVATLEIAPLEMGLLEPGSEPSEPPRSP